jgi:hypothetical protein
MAFEETKPIQEKEDMAQKPRHQGTTKIFPTPFPINPFKALFQDTLGIVFHSPVLRSWVSLVEGHSKKDLTKSSDRFNAFAGLFLRSANIFKSIAQEGHL